MGAVIDFDPVMDLQTAIVDDERNALYNWIIDGSKYMRDQIRSSYDTGGVRDSSEPWKPTSLRALFERKTFPRSADLATQMSYIQGAKTLIDTGSLMNSIDFDIAGTDTHLVASIGAGLSYIQTHEEGGEIEGHTVPERKSQFITEPEAQHLERLLEDEFERDS